jgi:hypothetical protein
VFVDGALGSHTAFLHAPYADAAFALRASHSRGRPLVRLGAVRLSGGAVDRVRRVVGSKF